MAMTHMFLSTLLSAADFEAAVSLEYSLLAGDGARVSTPGRHYFSPYITTMDWNQNPVQHAVLGLSK